MSVDAPHATDTLDDVVPVAANPAGTEGADVSDEEQANVAAVIDERAERFPAASYASTPNVYDVPHDKPENAKLVPVPFEESDVPMYRP